MKMRYENSNLSMGEFECDRRSRWERRGAEGFWEVLDY